jgi:hypothetical protein
MPEPCIREFAGLRDRRRRRPVAEFAAGLAAGENQGGLRRCDDVVAFPRMSAMRGAHRGEGRADAARLP